MLEGLMNFIFNNIILFLVIGVGIFIYTQYKNLKTKRIAINSLFTQVLDEYLTKRINEAKDITTRILQEYNREDEVNTEISRLLTMIEKGIQGSANDKVETSNAINRFKLSKNINLDRYPMLAELNNIGTFTEEDMNSLDNGVAIARRDYNAEAFRYNEKASEFPSQYLVKLFGLREQYIIFDPPKSKMYEQTYEVFEEEEPEIHTLEAMNIRTDTSIDLPKEKETNKNIEIEHSDTILKPTLEIEEIKEE